MLQTPHEDHERALLRGLLWLLAIRLVLLAGGWALPGKYSSPALPFLASVLTGLLVFFLPYWLITFILRRIPQDSSLTLHPAQKFVEPPEWASTLDALPQVTGLAPNDRMRLGRLISQFLRTVQFEGANGLEITDHIRLTIAAQACVLTLNLPRGALGRLKTIIVYPTTFVTRRFSWHSTDQDESGTAALGESWHKGTVILAWDDVQAGVADPHDGQNVAFHEFAHQLDSLEGDADGTPPLAGGGHRYQTWVTVLEDSFARFSRQVRKGRRSALDPYGSTNPAEFFAVATESFFERPDAMQREFPELYDQMRQYYRQDPAAKS